MLLQVLRTLKGLSTEFTFVRLQWNMYSNVGSDMIALDGGGSAGIPPTGEIQVVCTFPSDMLLAYVILEGQLVMGQWLSVTRGYVQRELRQTCTSRSICPTDRPSCHRQRQLSEEPQPS
jgi:hypothetical protein